METKREETFWREETEMDIRKCSFCKKDISRKRVNAVFCGSLCLQKSWRLNHPWKRRSYGDKYIFGGNREKAILRDGNKCVICGMTREQHFKTYGRDITVDHKNRNRRINRMSNLKTLCLSCHGKKDCDGVGEDSFLAKLSKEQVRKIRSMKLVYGKNKDIAKMFNVSPATISDIRNRRRYKNVE